MYGTVRRAILLKMAGITQIDSRQAKARANYTNPKSDTFGDLKNSMIEAGYDEEYADSIHGRKPRWLTEVVENNVKMMKRAETNLRKVNDADIPFDEENLELTKVQQYGSMFILKTLGKAKYGDELEKTPPNVQVNIIKYGDSEAVEAKVIDGQVSASPTDSQQTDTPVIEPQQQDLSTPLPTPVDNS